ncbi:hypothetical protein LP420_03070 [Massilia sp. B-10]|nr:hypothetical protein LP420_03070 [Massilia sp. B-10]
MLGQPAQHPAPPDMVVQDRGRSRAVPGADPHPALGRGGGVQRRQGRGLSADSVPLALS